MRDVSDILLQYIIHFTFNCAHLLISTFLLVQRNIPLHLYSIGNEGVLSQTSTPFVGFFQLFSSYIALAAMNHGSRYRATTQVISEETK